MRFPREHFTFARQQMRFAREHFPFARQQMRFLGSVSTLVEKWKTRHHPALRRKPNKPPGRAALEDDAMDNDNKKRELKEAFGPDTIEQFMRDEIRGKLEKLIEEEVRQALGVGRYERNGEERRGYLNGTRPRTLTTSLGPTAFAMPRARLKTEDGGTTEWSGRVVRRYQRRTLRRSEEHTSELQSPYDLVCRLLLEKKNR